MAKGMESVSFFFPMYLEEENIARVVKEARAVLKRTGRNFEIIVIDDGSMDKTGEIADRLAKEIKEMRVIHHRKNMGYGTALTTGFLNARKELVGFTDGDGQFSLENLPRFLDAISGADMVIGYRANRAEGLRRVFLQEGYKLLMHLVLGIKFKDPDCGFKLLRRKAFQKIKPASRSTFFSAEMLYRAKENGFVVKEIPVKHLKRLYGTSKCFNVREILTVAGEMLKMRFGKK